MKVTNKKFLLILHNFVFTLYSSVLSFVNFFLLHFFTCTYKNTKKSSLVITTLYKQTLVMPLRCALFFDAQATIEWS